MVLGSGDIEASGEPEPGSGSNVSDCPGCTRSLARRQAVPKRGRGWAMSNAPLVRLLRLPITLLTARLFFIAFILTGGRCEEPRVISPPNTGWEVALERGGR